MQMIDAQGICDFAAQNYGLMANRYAFGEPLYNYFDQRSKMCRQLSAHFSEQIENVGQRTKVAPPSPRLIAAE
jgi:hypothetical protein